MITERKLDNVYIVGCGLVGCIDCCLSTKSSLCLLKSVFFSVFNLSAFCCGVFLLCGIGKGVTEGNGFAFFALLSGLVLPLSFGFKIFFVRVVILSDKSLTAVDSVVKSSYVLSNYFLTTISI